MNFEKKEYDYVNKKSIEIIDDYNFNDELKNINYIILPDFNEYLPKFRNELITILKYNLTKQKRKCNIKDFHLCKNKDSNKYFIIIAGKSFKKNNFEYEIIENNSS